MNVNFSDQSQSFAKPIVLNLSGAISEQIVARRKIAKMLQCHDQPKPLVIVKGLSETQRKTATSLASLLWSEEQEESQRILPDLAFAEIVSI
jgi:hypothetical protein